MLKPAREVSGSVAYWRIRVGSHDLATTAAGTRSSAPVLRPDTGVAATDRLSR